MNGLLGLSALLAAMSDREARPIHGVLATGLMLVVFTTMNTVLRRKMIQTETNLKHLRSIWITVCLVFCQQLYSWHQSIPLEQSLRVTLLVLIAMSSVLAVTLVKKMIAITASALAALALSLIHPGQPLYAGAMFCIVNSIAFATWLSLEPEPASPPG